MRTWSKEVYDQIADLTLRSEIDLPLYEPFRCESADADVTLYRTEALPAPGPEIVSGTISHRVQRDGWFCHPSGTDRTGVFISGDYASLGLLGRGKTAEYWASQQGVRVALECLLARRGYATLHSAAVVSGGMAYAFTGPSGVGKSTRARVWTQHLGAELLSGDRPLMRVSPLEAYGVPWDGKEQCFRREHYPLKAVFEVRRGDFFRVRKLSAAQARRLLAAQTFMPMWDAETSALQMRNLFRLADSGRVLRVYGPPTEENALLLYRTVLDGSFLKEEPDMKAKPGFILRKVMDEYMLMPAGENIGTFSGMVLLNSVSAFVWEKLQSPMSRDELLAAVTAEYDVDEETAAADLDALLEKLKAYDVIEEG